MPFPGPGPVAIKSVSAEIVDEFNNSVPLSEVYNHHWSVCIRSS